MSAVQVRLRIAMSRRDMSGETFAAALGVRFAKVYDITHGRLEPSLDMLCAISETLGVDLHWLLTGNGPMDLPDADHSEIQLPPVSPLPEPDRGAEPACFTSHAGNLPEGASCNFAPSGTFSNGEALEVARSNARAAVDAFVNAGQIATHQGRAAAEAQPSLLKRMLPWLGDIIGCVSLFALLFLGLWAGEILR